MLMITVIGKPTNQKNTLILLGLCVLNDINIVMNKADYLICLWDQNVMKGAGTHAEITLAFMEQKPVYLVNMLSSKISVDGSWHVLLKFFQIFPISKNILKKISEWWDLKQLSILIVCCQILIF